MIPQALGCCLLGFLLLQQGGEAAKGPRAWKDFGTGAWASLRIRQWSPSGRLADDWTEKKVYRGLEGDEAVFEISVETALGPPPLQKTNRRTEPYLPGHLRDKSWTREKEETLRLAGKEVVCEVFLQKSPAGESRSWVAKEASALPDPVVKLEWRGESDRDDGALADWDVAVTLGEKTYRCVRYDFKKTASNPVTSFESREWRSKDVPGHLVKGECDYGGGGRQLDELAAFSVPPKK